MDNRDNAGHVAAAEAEARDRGMAFLVDGRHVSADRIMILSVPDTIGPISDMRRAKSEAIEVLERLNVARTKKPSEIRVKLSADAGELQEHVSKLLEELGAHHGTLRKMRRYHMQEVVSLRSIQRTTLTDEGRQSIEKLIVTHLNFVQCLNAFFSVTDNDHIGDDDSERVDITGDLFATGGLISGS